MLWSFTAVAIGLNGYYIPHMKRFMLDGSWFEKYINRFVFVKSSCLPKMGAA